MRQHHEHRKHCGGPANGPPCIPRHQFLPVNGHCLLCDSSAFGADAPFGGYRQSGIGREMRIEGFEEYLQTKTVAVPG
jgi:hypothetical protein